MGDVVRCEENVIKTNSRIKKQKDNYYKKFEN